MESSPLDWHFLTFFGDSMLLLPTALVLFLVLLSSAATRRAGWQWGFIFGCVGAIVCASKLAFIGWGIGSAEYDFTGFSGHSALSASIWPAFLWLICARCRPLLRRTAVLIGYLLPLAIGWSRLAIHVHSTSEVITGLILGLSASTLFLLLQRRSSPPRLGVVKTLILLALPVLLMGHRQPAPTQSLLEKIAVTLADRERPYTRADLHKLLK
ncbi:phosphatase PAP2 family protein [Serratia rubidaea]|uniref:phosphatase PAP2 family protein n=1 Tax=Serratia rubidaea TaxID=61652 RepID=UPI000773EF54|nr:phosphatase PAP2 family protein [Serratia rubidaea]